MLKLRLRAAGADEGEWSWDGNRWARGWDWVEPFPHAAVEHVACTDGHATFISVRERLLGFSGQQAAVLHYLSHTAYVFALEQSLSWPLEHLTVESRPHGRWVVHAGLWGTAPLYLTAKNGVVHGSWDLTHLRALLSEGDLDEVTVAMFLGGRPGYSQRTLFGNVARLTERATAVVDQGELRLSYPSPAAHAIARKLRDDVDVVGAYDEILTSAVNRYDLPWNQAAVEVSGGLDSANVAVSATCAAAPLISCGLLLSGPEGMQQQARRTNFLRGRSFRDITQEAANLPPFCLQGRRGNGEPFSPEEEPYGEAVAGLIQQVAAAGGTVVFTGIGGDELTSLRSWERATQATDTESVAPSHGRSMLTEACRQLLDQAAEEHEAVPATVVPETALLAVSCRSPVFLRQGCWPISPLCTPEVVRFCEWLPAKWRQDRYLQRARLRRAGLSDHWLSPPLRENFAMVMQRGLRHHGLPQAQKMLHGSMLVDHGYVDAIALRRVIDHGHSAERVNPGLYDIVNAELGLRSLVEAT